MASAAATVPTYIGVGIVHARGGGVGGGGRHTSSSGPRMPELASRPGRSIITLPWIWLTSLRTAIWRGPDQTFVRKTFVRKV
jgi:hypothetical protein